MQGEDRGHFRRSLSEKYPGAKLQWAGTVRASCGVSALGERSELEMMVFEISRLDEALKKRGRKEILRGLNYREEKNPMHYTCHTM